MLAIFDLSLMGHSVLALRLVALLVVLVLPGTLLVARLGLECPSLVLRAGAVLGASCLVLMAGALAASWLLFAAGVSDPLGTVPLAVCFNGLALVLLIACRGAQDPVEAVWGGGRALTPSVALAALPLLAVLGAERLNAGDGSVVAQGVIWAAAAVLFVGLRRAGGDENTSALALIVASLCLLYLYSYRGYGLFGYDIQQEYQRFSATFAMQRWAPPSDGDPYAAMLSITALPTVLARLSGISGLFLFRGLYPVFTAFTPAFTFSFARRWLLGRAAYLGACFMVVLSDFASQMPALARQEVGLFYFALLLWAIFNPSLEGRRRTVAVVALMAALVVSHYSSSYVALSLFAATWCAYSAGRLVLRWARPPLRASKPLVSFAMVAAMLSMVVVWDVGVTNSSANVTSFVSSLADNGLDVLPNDKSASVVDRYLKGTVPAGITPTGYYTETASEARKTEPWLNPFPRSVVERYPARAAPAPPTVKGVLPGLAQAVGTTDVVLDEVFLAAIGVGVLVLIGTALSKRRAGAPLEVSLLSAAALVFLAIVRLSGTVDALYNSDRAELQAAIVLSVALGATVSLAVKRAPIASWVTMTALAFMLVYSIGETNHLVGGGEEVTTANSGYDYESFVIQQQEVAAARWMVATAGPKAVFYTDDVGQLRIWEATPYTGLPQNWLTPGALARGAWVYASEHNVVDGVAFGGIDGKTVSYAFPEGFLVDEYDRVYTSPATAVYY